MKCLFVYLYLLLFSSLYGIMTCKNRYDYYWRDYTGEIPCDAVSGGSDVNNRTTYIGQVYIKDKGIIPVMIYPGKKSVVANIDGLHTIDTYIKILCSASKHNMKWLPANEADLHLKMINKHLVRGGTEHDLVTNIGRVSYQGEVIVGKICAFSIGNAKMYFPGKNKEEDATSYEALVYETDFRTSEFDSFVIIN